MDRRDAIKSLAALPFFKISVPGQTQQADAIEVKKGTLIIFADPECFNFDLIPTLESTGPNDPLNEAIFFPVQPRRGQTVTDAIALYKVEHESNK